MLVPKLKLHHPDWPDMQSSWRLGTINPRLTGVHSTTDRWGLSFAPPIFQIYRGQFFAPGRSGKSIEGKLTLLTSGSPMTSQIRSKSKYLTIWVIWFCRAPQPYHMEISQCSSMGESGTLLSSIPSYQWAYSRSRPFKVTRSRKGQTENVMFGRSDTCV